MHADISRIRNIAIVAHVDHGKTTLVDQLLRQSGTLGPRAAIPDRVMDSNDLERERGITILSKNTAILWQGWRINIVDTPGHADFGGEVERALSMVDSVLLLVDAVDGPMPQTTFVTRKALARGLRPIVVVNKVDRPSARPDWVVDQTFDLFDRLGASHDQLDFAIIYASALEGWASTVGDVRGGDMTPLFRTIVDRVPQPDVDPEGPFQLQVSALDYSSYIGVIGIGRIRRGRVLRNSQVAIVDVDGEPRRGRLLQILGFHGLERIEMEEASAGDIVAFSGIEGLKISETVCDPEAVEGLPPLAIDEPTISMTFQVNNSPFAGREGKYVTSRNLRERLDQELLHNVALRVEPTADPDKFKVSGRGELHLSILVENDAAGGLRAGDLAAGGDPEDHRRRRLRAVGDADRRRRGAAPGRGDGTARRAARRAAGHLRRRPRPGAARLPDPQPRAARLPLGVSYRDLRDRHSLPRLRDLRPRRYPPTSAVG